MDYPQLAPTQTEEIEPSVWYAFIGLPFAFIGIVIFVTALVGGIRHIADSMVQIAIPGGMVLQQLSPQETYTVFIEKGVVLNGKTYSDWSSLEGMTCYLRSASGGPFVSLRGTPTLSTYSWGARSARSVLEFTVPRGGNYEFSCESVDESRAKPGVVGIVPGVGRDFGTIFGTSFLALLGGCGIGLVIFLIVVSARDRSKRRIRAAGLRPV